MAQSPRMYGIRADHDTDSIVMYQAFSDAIADAALANGRFVTPFSFTRMTWIKRSFLWLVHRSNWARKPGQQRILAVRLSREGWETALSRSVLTTSHPDAVTDAAVHVQWDPERSIRGAALDHYIIQVGVGRGLIRTLADEWTLGIDDLTPTVRKIATRVQSGQADRARRLLPAERAYPLPPALTRRITPSDR